MSSVILFMFIAAVALVGMTTAYFWPHAEVRVRSLYVATVGALVGSLVGRVVSDPRWLGHVFYVAGGAVVFAALEWLLRTRRSAA